MTLESFLVVSAQISQIIQPAHQYVQNTKVNSLPRLGLITDQDLASLPDTPLLPPPPPLLTHQGKSQWIMKKQHGLTTLY